MVFADEKLQKAYFRVRDENPMLYKFLDRATDDLKANPECGITIPKRLIPKIYKQKYGKTTSGSTICQMPGGWFIP